MLHFLEPCDLEIWRMTFKNNREPLLCYFKLCASFRSHWRIQSGVKSPETPNLGQIWQFLAPCDLEIWRMTLKNIRAPLLSISYSPETVKLGVDLCDLDLWPLTLTSGMDVTFVIGNNSWKFHDDTMMGTWWKRCDGRTDGWTDWTSHIAAWSQLKIMASVQIWGIAIVLRDELLKMKGKISWAYHLRNAIIMMQHIHCGLMIPYDDMDLGQHRYR